MPDSREKAKTFRRRKAILVGCPEYESDRWGDLGYIQGDIQGDGGWVEVLQNLGAGSFRKEDIHVLAEKIDHRAVMHKLLELSLKSGLTEEDFLLIYFSGHGAKDEYLGGDPVFAAYDSDPSDLMSTGVPFGWVRDSILRKSIASVMLVVDCCYSGTLLDDFDWPETAGSKSLFILTSSSPDEESFAARSGEKSAFTEILLEGLHSATTGEGSRVVNSDSLVDYLARRADELKQNPRIYPPSPPFLLATTARLRKPEQEEVVDWERVVPWVRGLVEAAKQDPILTGENYIPNVGHASLAERQGAAWILRRKEDGPETASGLVSKWLGSEEGTSLIVLGDTGLGKTTLLRRLAVESAELFLNKKEKRFPLFLDLRVFSGVNLSDPTTGGVVRPGGDGFRRFRAILCDWLQSEEQLPVLWPQLLEMVQDGRILLLLDGLDEMCSDGRQESILTALRAISALDQLGGKMVLSCRTHFFHSDEELLRSLEESGFLRRRLEVVEVQPFQGDQIAQLMGLSLNEAGMERWRKLKKERILGLEALGRRPFLLELLISQLNSGLPLSPSGIYQELLNGWLERDRWRFDRFMREFRESIIRDLGLWDPELLEDEKRGRTDFWADTDRPEDWSDAVIRNFIELLATDLRLGDWKEDDLIPAEKIPDRIRTHFPSLPELFIDFFEYAIRTCSFLSRDGDGNYAFVHDSVQAYFTARRIHRELKASIYWWDRGPGRGEDPIKILPRSMGRFPLDDDLVVFLVDMLAPGDRDRLADIILSPSVSGIVRNNPYTLNYLAGNALTVLARHSSALNRMGWVPKVLHDRNLSGANLSNLALPGLDLRNAVLEDVSFRAADLTGSDLTGAKLVEVDIHGADLRDVKINGGSVVKLAQKQKPSVAKNVPDDFVAVEKETRLAASGKAAGRCYRRSPPIELTKMERLEGGRFQMGGDVSWADSREKPAHEVTVPPFEMEIHPVTNRQFREFVKANPEWGKAAVIDRIRNVYYLKEWDGDEPPGDRLDHPVVYVNWYAALAFAQWAGRRLPSEAEWEYALRDDKHEKGWIYPWGDDLAKMPRKLEEFTTRQDLSPVMSGPVNSLGLYGLLGNVNEWVLDWYGETHFAEGKDRVEGGVVDSDPQGPGYGREKVLRGGSFLDDLGEFYRPLACFFRAFLPPANTNQDGGFRCAKDV